MQPLQQFASGVLADIIRRQPASRERTTFAWSVVVGPAMARATSVELAGDVLTVRARDQRWAHEVHRARETVLARLQHLLGPDAVRQISILREV